MSDTNVEVVDSVEVEEREKKQRKQYNVSDEQFVEAWQTSRSAAACAEKLGMPKNIVLARSAVYRKRGIQLKKMERKNPRRLDVDKLNRKIESLGGAAASQE